MSLHGYVRTRGSPSFDGTQRYCRVNVLRARFAAPRFPRSRAAPWVTRTSSLEAADGNRFAAFAARPEEPSGKGVVILPDVRGLYRFYEELALRFAERGISAVAIDYFGRTAGVEKRGDDFDYMTHVDQTTPEGVKADVRAAVEHLRPPVKAVFTVGFCFGGRYSWHSAADGHGLAGAVGFYGAPRGRGVARGPSARGRDGVSDPRPPGGCRPEHHGGGQRGLRAGPHRGRRRARARDVRGRATQLLRPEAGGVRGRLGRCLAAHPDFLEREV